MHVFLLEEETFDIQTRICLYFENKKPLLTQCLQQTVNLKATSIAKLLFLNL